MGRTNRPPKRALRHLPAAIVLLLVFGLVGAMAIEPTRRLIEQRNRIDRISRNIAKIERSNGRLEARIARLKDPDYIEQRAHELRGLVRPGQTSYVVMPPAEGQGGEKRRKEPAEAPAPDDPGVLEGFLDFVGL